MKQRFINLKRGLVRKSSLSWVLQRLLSAFPTKWGIMMLSMLMFLLGWWWALSRISSRHHKSLSIKSQSIQNVFLGLLVHKMDVSMNPAHQMAEYQKDAHRKYAHKTDALRKDSRKV